MNSDNFTTAAEAEAGRLYPSDGIDILESRGLDGFAIGVIWARDYLATQEPTDAEVLAALNAHDPTVSTPNLSHYAPSHVEAMRAALTAARDARRDEKDKP